MRMYLRVLMTGLRAGRRLVSGLAPARTALSRLPKSSKRAGGLLGSATAVALLLLGARFQPVAADIHITAITSAPTILTPANGISLTSFAPVLTWENPGGATQIQVQIRPSNGDGPGADVYLGTAATMFAVLAPPQWSGLLPDMTYTWQVRASDAPSAADLDDDSWGPWAVATFRTPRLSSSTISLTEPALGAVVSSLRPTLVWANTDTNAYYYEVQMSKDRTFTTDPATATAMVYWELRHGGVTVPPNSYTVPSAWPLEPNTTYYWRVRPRVQGDGTPVAWSSSSSFSTSALVTATPTATSTAVATVTATPTVTGTPGTGTVTATPTVTGTPGAGTATPTATGTPGAGTVTATPTVTGTPGSTTATPTQTSTAIPGTGTPTATGTSTPVGQ